jgi:carbamoyl-phosphate synthase large subunit
MLSVGYKIPKKGILISSGDAKQKAELLSASKLLIDKGYKLFATGGSHRFLVDNNVPATKVFWPSETGMEPQAMQLLHSKEIDFVINIPKNLTQVELDNGYKIRRTAIDLNIPLITNARLASAFINAFCTISIDQIQIKSWDEYKS